MQTSMCYLATHIFDYWFCNKYHSTVPYNNFYSCCFCDYSTSMENVSVTTYNSRSYYIVGASLSSFTLAEMYCKPVCVCMFGATYLKFQCADLNIQNFVEIGYSQRIHAINRETGGAVQVSRRTIVVSTGSKLFCD